MTFKLPTGLNEEEFTKLIKATNKERFKVAFLLGYASGLRISEIVKLQRDHIDLKEKRISIYEGKGDKDRVVPLPKGFKDKHISLFPLPYKNLDSGIRSLEIAFKLSAKKAGLNNNLHFHSLRHSFAQRCIKQGMALNQIQLLMGHSNIAVTSVYLKARPDEALKSYEELF